jgi:hypothetical protein
MHNKNYGTTHVSHGRGPAGDTARTAAHGRFDFFEHELDLGMVLEKPLEFVVGADIAHKGSCRGNACEDEQKRSTPKDAALQHFHARSGE